MSIYVKVKLEKFSSDSQRLQHIWVSSKVKISIFRLHLWVCKSDNMR